MMSYWKLFRGIFRFFLFWLLLAMLDRIVFLSVFWAKYPEAAPLQLFQSCLHGLRMDLSMAAYLSLLPFLVFVIRLLMPGWRVPVPDVFLRIYTGVCIVFFMLVSVANLFLYMEWSEKISLKALDLFMTSPKEALASLPVWQLVLLFLVVVLLVWFFLRIYDRLFVRNDSFSISRILQEFPDPKIRIMGSVGFVLLLSFLLFSCIRGGYGRAPMNPSMVYFSSVPFLNHAAVNTHWYLLDDVLKHKNTNHPFRYLEQEQVSAIIRERYGDRPDLMDPKPQHVLSPDVRPNIVLIILEGFTAELVKSLGGEQGIAPGFEKLIGEGLLFDRIYSVAERSDKGIVGLLSGFPAQGPQSVIRSVGKLEKLPSIAEEFKQAGYQTSFYYGGQSAFYNLKSYVLMKGYDSLTDLDSFDDVKSRSSWGIYDEQLFERNLQDLGQMKQPFFSTVYTLTNHHPFELPGTYRFGRDGMGNQFRSTAFYTDSVLYDYLEKAKSRSWYANTLFVVVSDHGHRLPEDRWEIYQHQRHHIPLLLFGPVLREEYKGMRISRIGSQTDFARTILQQTNLPYRRYHWSNNLLDDHQEGHAFYNWQTGFGLLTAEGAVSYDFVGNHIISAFPDDMPQATQDRLLQQAKALMQQVYTEYLAY